MSLRPIEVKAWLNWRVYNEIVAEANCWSPKETGGILMGYWPNCDEVVITDWIGPGHKADHDLYSFSPDSEWQEKEIARIYKETGRVVTYLGDWHSHPYGYKNLSIRDFLVLHRVANFSPSRLATPIMGILWNSSGWELAVWRYSLNGFRFPVKKLNIIWWEGFIEVSHCAEEDLDT